MFERWIIAVEFITSFMNSENSLLKGAMFVIPLFKDQHEYRCVFV